MHELSLGAIDVVVLNDGTWSFPAKAFFANAPEERWRENVHADTQGRIPVGHHCALVAAGDDLILIDTGYGADTHGGCTGRLVDEIERAGRRPADVTVVVNTHAHGDHIKGNTRVRDRIRVPTYPNARYVLGRGDWMWFNGHRGGVHEFPEHIAFLAGLEKLTLAEGDERINSNVRLVATPGHTPGHMSVLVESGDRTAIFLGDVCHHPLHVAEPEWVSEFDSHPHVTPRTRAALFELAVEREALVILPHAPPPGLGRIERSNTGFRWRAAA